VICKKFYPADTDAGKIGKLFEQMFTNADGHYAAFINATPREFLTTEGVPNWNKIPPEILGDIFQDMMNAEDRHDIGAHYTSEWNILKVIRPLFLDGLREEFDSIAKLSPSLREERLKQFHEKLCALKFLDPACGCGNFLAVAYRELRLLEIEVISLLTGKERTLDISTLVKVNVNQFYGIEIEEFPAQIAQTAMWLTDHQMNLKVSETFGRYFVRIPLTAAAHIRNTNALTTDWESIVPKEQLSYILGNPPFVGSRIMSREQKNEVKNIFKGLKNFGDLDYVTCWYKKAAEYIQNTKIEVAFVSTNSICQGLQVSVVWSELMNKFGVKINFAHQTFKWRNEARGNAAVYCVIIGFGLFDRKEKKIFHYADVSAEPIGTIATKINAYLIDADTIFIAGRSKPLCDAPEMNFGNMPADGGYLLFTPEEKEAFLKEEPAAAPYIRPLIAAKEFLNGGERWCLWLNGIDPGILRRELKKVYRRVNQVKKARLASARPQLAAVPQLFAQITQPEGKDFVLIPSTSSERRRYIPMSFFTADYIAHNSCHIITEATVYHFGVLTSAMHMAWTRYVCGRLEMRYRYSKDIVYNNFPWPNPTEKQKEKIESAARNVLDVRAKFSESSLADLYDPLAMPAVLARAHQALDSAVDAAYGRTFADDSERVAYLFEVYQKLNGELFRDEKKRGKGRKVKTD
jgi:hypothetical protein